MPFEIDPAQTQRAGPRCMFCGQSEHVRLLEVFEDGAFLLDTCCEAVLQVVSQEELSDDAKAAARWLADELQIKQLCAAKLRRVVDHCGHLLLDWNLEVVPVSWQRARGFIANHHPHCPAPAGWRFGAGVRNGRQLVGVVSVGRPVARAFDHTRIVEVNRLCVRTDVPHELVWNACSLLYGWAAREAKRRGFSKIVTYTHASEAATTLRVAAEHWLR